MEIVENKNSEARDFLALERTYLAWCRTCIAFIVLGIGLIEFKIFILGIFLIILGNIFSIISLLRYFQVKNSLLKNNFIINNLVIIFTSIICFLLSLIGLFIILYEKYFK
jgi:putative membrane protein